MNKNLTESKDILYLLAMFMLSFAKGIGLASSDRSYLIVSILSFVLIFSKVLREKWPVNRLMYYMLFLFLVLINFIITKRTELLFTSFIIIGIKSVSITKTLKVVFWARFIAFITMVSLVLFGIVDNTTLPFYRNGVQFIRYGFGYNHPNLFHLSFFLIVLLFCYLYTRYLNIFSAIFILFINELIVNQSYSRTSYYLVILCVVLFYLSKHLKKLSQWIAYFTRYIQWFLLILAFVLAKLYGRLGFTLVLNDLFSGRLYYDSVLLSVTPKILGRFVSGENVSFDNSYTMLLSGVGLVITFLFMVLFYRVAKVLYTHNKYQTLLLFFCLSLAMYTESFYPNGLMNFTLFYFSQYVFDYEELLNEN